MNAAIWLGAAVFFTFGAGPAVFSHDMQQVLGANNFPYFSGAIAQVLLVRYFDLLLACAVAALLHLSAEWLYSGRPARKSSLALLIALLGLALLGGNWLQPKLKKLNEIHYAANMPAARRAYAARWFRIWHATATAANLLMIGGLIVYTWRVANPAEPLRFVSPVKFR